jgi:serine/threonine protein phosphatase 1
MEGSKASGGKMKSNTYVIGDIHGRVYALNEVLLKAGYNNETDRLIVLGDVCDRGPKVREVIDRLLRIKNVILIKGNHDAWALDWMTYGIESDGWLMQGGRSTEKSYGFNHESVPLSHLAFLKKAVLYHIEEGSIYVHGGFDPEKPIEEQDEETLIWDRDLIDYAQKQEIEGYKRVFIGHTPTENITKKTEPAFFHNLVLLDCGAGYSGQLCMMNVEDLSYVLSENQKH